MSTREITPQQLHQLLQSSEPPSIVDVREPWEVSICALPGSIDIPLRSLPHRLQEIPAGGMVAVICHHGVRSLMAAEFLTQQGLNAVSVAGGIARWAAQIDPAMARY